MTAVRAGCFAASIVSLAAAAAAPLAVAQEKDVRPSFDCDETTTVVERVICSHPELAKLDVEMMRLFREAVRNAPAAKRSELLTEQARWTAQRNDCGETDSEPVQRCIESAYRLRIQQLTPPKKQRSASAHRAVVGVVPWVAGPSGNRSSPTSAQPAPSRRK